MTYAKKKAQCIELLNAEIISAVVGTTSTNERIDALSLVESALCSDIPMPEALLDRIIQLYGVRQSDKG